ncbi:MAG: aminotransferase class V-fold PLP-dependent enzyme, partial [Saccharofermentanaceae bacterium]
MSINVNISHREDFPLLRDSNIVYLDNAATSQKPDCVIEAVEEFYHKHNANQLRGFYELAMLATEQLENSRTTVKEFINAKFEEEVIFTKGTTESINLIANSYGMNFLGEGDEILISIMEHHCNILPWQFVASKTGAVLKYLECDMDGLISDTAIEEAITDKTKIVAITQLSNVLGRENPIARITKTAHEHGAIVVMDAAQSVVHVKIDVQALDVDFMAFSGHKIMSPMGIGILYGKKELLNKMPPFLRGGEMIESVTRT